MTARERQVAEWVGPVKSSTEIAYILGVSDAAVTNCTARAQEKLGLAVANQVQSIFRKMGVRSRAELVVRLQSPR